MSKKGGKIKNTISASKNAKSNITPNNDYKMKPAVLDFSFIGSLQSVEVREFNNYTKNPNDYISCLRNMIKNVSILSEKTLNELITGGSYKHCHKITDNEDILARDVIRKLFDSNNLHTYDQEIGDMELYQLGCQDGVRFVGTIVVNSNIFRVYFVDYFHSLYPDQKQNKRNLNHYKFCPMTGYIE